MPAIDPERSILVVVDFQGRLMPAIHDGDAAVHATRKLLDMAALLEIPVLFTEQNPKGLGTTVESLVVEGAPVLHKMSFDACRQRGFLEQVAADRHVVVTGCEAHVCVQQTVLGLVASGRHVYVVADAIGSRRAQNKEAALRRMERHGAEIVTAEMVMFEWLESAENPRFRQAMALIK